MKWRARHLLVLALAVVGGVASGTPVLAQSDPLPFWNEGAAKQAIVKFVEATTTQGSPKFVPPAERIATSTKTAPCGWSIPCTRRSCTASTACPPS